MRLEQDFGLLASLLLCLRIDQRALSVATDVLFDLLFFVLDPIFSTPFAPQHTIHGGELVVADGRFVRATVRQSIETVRALVERAHICIGFKVVTCSKFVRLRDILFGNLLNYVVLGVQSVEQTTVMVQALPVWHVALA